MSSSKTKNLNMHSWAATDAVLRSEFNDNFNLIDSAVGTVSSTLGGLSSSFGSCEIYTGLYVGTGGKTHSLHFDKLPDIIVVQLEGSATPHLTIVKDEAYISASEASSILSISGSDITFTNVSSSKNSLNVDGNTYYYVALCSVK